MNPADAVDSDMEDADLLRRELQSRQRQEERKEALWEVLEQKRAMPDSGLLGYLSGLLDDDIERMRSLWNELHQDVRRELVQTLQEMAEADFAMDFSAIFRIALRDEDAETRATAIRSLDEIEDVRLVRDFVELLEHDPTSLVRSAAAGALANFVLLGELQKIRPSPFNAAVVALFERHTDPSESFEVQQIAIESMAYTGTHNVPDLIEQAYRHTDDRMRKSALLAMGRSADPRWSAIIQRELHNPNPDMRLEATRACGELQLRAAVKEVSELTEDVDARIRRVALWSLGQIGGKLARKTLQRYIDADDETMRTIAEDALQELEFFYGNLSTFFGPPADYEQEDAWPVPSLSDRDLDDEAPNEDAAYEGDEDEADDPGWA